MPTLHVLVPSSVFTISDCVRLLFRFTFMLSWHTVVPSSSRDGRVFFPDRRRVTAPFTFLILPSFQHLHTVTSSGLYPCFPLRAFLVSFILSRLLWPFFVLILGLLTDATHFSDCAAHHVRLVGRFPHPTQEGKRQKVFFPDCVGC